MLDNYRTLELINSNGGFIDRNTKLTWVYLRKEDDDV